MSPALNTYLSSIIRPDKWSLQVRIMFKPLVYCTALYGMIFLRTLQESAVKVFSPIKKGISGRDISIGDLLLGEQTREVQQLCLLAHNTEYTTQLSQFTFCLTRDLYSSWVDVPV